MKSFQASATPVKIALIGMSGIGKSHWGRRLRDEAGFDWWCCDDEIQAELKKRYADPALVAADGVGLASWMKNPWEAEHPAREQEYLNLEGLVTSRALENIERSSNSFLLDTTGSVIYLNSSILERLKRSCLVVWCQHSEEQAALLYETFLQHPKPLVWGSAYRPLPGEPPEVARGRCFKELLASRTDLYRKLAHKSISMAQHRDSNLTPQQFIEMVLPR